ncbi:MAG: hypothetical protein JXA35_05385 [Deltaproteobacteria bacterium]|nr:hypothetical protein [Deltaproteobacteria bacterium]
MLFLSMTAYGQEITKEQLKGLDEQVQEIKSEVLSIAADLNILEEKLIYPSNTQISVFVSLEKDETFRLDSLEVKLEGEPVAHHIYTYKELEALQKGGVQRIYTGNIRSGRHDLQVSMIGKSPGGSELEKTESYFVEKGVGPKIVEIRLTSDDINIREQ